MLDWIVVYFQKQLENNQLFSGGLILMICGGLAAYFRQVPTNFYHFVRGKLITEIDILDRDTAFEWIELWLASHPYAQNRARSLTVKTIPVDYQTRQSQPSLDARPRILFTPAPGVHWLFFRGRLVCLHRERPKAKDPNQPMNVRESFNVTIYSRNRALAKELLEEAREIALPKSQSKLTIHRAEGSYWNEQAKRMPRPVESVILPEGVMEDLLTDIRAFLAKRDWYLQRGIPYRRGYLLYGPPGTGKSSAVLAAASDLGMDISTLSLGNTSLDDNGIAELFSDVPVNSLVLMEDIDCTFLERKDGSDSKGKVSFSGLLNAIDGVAASEGRILMATTNHIDRLDAALIRPGRIDRKVFIGYANRDQAARLFLRFFPEATLEMANFFGESIPENRWTMSELQMHLLRYANDRVQAIARLDELLEEPSKVIQHTADVI